MIRSAIGLNNECDQIDKISPSQRPVLKHVEWVVSSKHIAVREDESSSPVRCDRRVVRSGTSLTLHNQTSRAPADVAAGSTYQPEKVSGTKYKSLLRRKHRLYLPWQTILGILRFFAPFQFFFRWPRTRMLVIQ